MSVGDILSDTFARVRERFWGLLGVWAVFAVIMIAGSVAFFAVLGRGVFALTNSMESVGGPGAGMGIGMILLVIAFYIVYLLIAAAQYAALNAMASPIRNADLGEAISTGFRSSPTLLLVMVLFIIAYFLLALVAGVVFAVLAQAGSAGSIIGVIILFLAVLYLACRVSVVFPIVPIDGVRNPITAIARSWSLTRGHALAIFLAFLVLAIVATVLFAIVIVPSIGSIGALQAGDLSGIGGAMTFIFVGATVVSALVAMSYSAMLASIHARLAGEHGVAETFE